MRAWRHAGPAIVGFLGPALSSRPTGCGIGAWLRLEPGQSQVSPAPCSPPHPRPHPSITISRIKNQNRQPLLSPAHPHTARITGTCRHHVEPTTCPRHANRVPGPGMHSPEPRAQLSDHGRVSQRGRSQRDRREANLTRTQFNAKQARREAQKAAKQDNELKKQIQNVRPRTARHTPSRSPFGSSPTPRPLSLSRC